MSMLAIFRFDDTGKVEHTKFWRNEMAMLIDVGMMPSPTGKVSPDLAMPGTETEVHKAEPTANKTLVDMWEGFEKTASSAPGRNRTWRR